MFVASAAPPLPSLVSRKRAIVGLCAIKHYPEWCQGGRWGYTTSLIFPGQDWRVLGFLRPHPLSPDD